MNRRELILSGLGVALLSTVTGCGPSDGLRVRGTVMSGGQPVKLAAVTFTAVDQSGFAASGMTDESGRFTLIHPTQPSRGIPAGNYKVTVTRAGESSPTPTAGDDRTQAMLDAYKKARQEKRRTVIANTLPPRYASFDTTPLTITLPHSDKITLQLEP